MNSMRHISILLSFLIIESYGLNSIASVDWGNVFLKLGAGHSALKSKTIANNFYQPGGAGGEVKHNVNIFTGQPSYNINLASISVRGEVSFPVGINFSGPTRPIIASDNRTAPVGWIGAGWSLNIPFVSVNHKNTFTYSDDVVYCNLGQYGGGQILQEPETDKFYVSTNPAIDVSVNIQTTGDLVDQIESWVFTMPNGVRLIFGTFDGQVNNSERIMQYEEGVIIGSPYNPATSKPFIYRWDISRIEDNSGANGIDFEHHQHMEPLYGGKSYTRESYIRNIKWEDDYGNEIQRIQFDTEQLNAANWEFYGYYPFAPKTEQKLYETRRLKEIKVYNEGSLFMKYSFARTTLWTMPSGKKRTLSGIDISYGTYGSVNGWEFEYEELDPQNPDDFKYFLLKEVTTPSLTKETFEYTNWLFWRNAGRQDGLTYPFINNQTGSELVIPTNQNTLVANWINESNCDESFCYEIIKAKDFDGSKDRGFVRIYNNTGNYFQDTVAYHATLGDDWTEHTQWQVIPLGNYFLVIGKLFGSVDVWEWDGKRFHQIDDEIIGDGVNDPIRTNKNFGGQIEVYPSGNYFVVYRKTNGYKTWVYMKDAETGQWKSLTYGNTGTETCAVDNHNGYGGTVRSGTECFSWTDDLIIGAGRDMFFVAHEATDIIYGYTMNREGTGFNEISNKFPLVSPSIPQNAAYYNDWNRNLKSFKMGPDYFIVECYTTTGSNNAVITRYDVFMYDGNSINHVQALTNDAGSVWEHNDGNDRFLYLSGNYLIEANLDQRSDRNIVFWKKIIQSNDVAFSKSVIKLHANTDGSNVDLLIRTHPKFFTVEYYPEGSLENVRTKNAPRKDNTTGTHDTWLYKITTDGSWQLLPSASYSTSLSGCSQKLWDMSFSPNGNLMTSNYSKQISSCDVCVPGGACGVDRIATLIFGDSPDPSTSSFMSAADGADGVALVHNGWSLSGNLGQHFILDPATGRAKTRRYFFGGPEYFTHADVDVVTKYISSNGIGDNHEISFVREQQNSPLFNYIQEFNHNTRMPQFEETTIQRLGHPGSMSYLLNVDYIGQKLILDSALLIGRTKIVSTSNGQGDLMNITDNTYLEPYTRGYDSDGNRIPSITDPWPKGLVVNRIDQIQNMVIADNLSKQITINSFHHYNDINENPRYSQTLLGDSWRINQTIFNTLGLPVQNISYDYTYDPAMPNGPINWSLITNHGTELSVNPADGQYFIAYAKRDYESIFSYKEKKNYLWRDEDASLSDNNLKEPKIPVYNIHENVIPIEEITYRNSRGQPLEIKNYVSSTGYTYTSTFYEGRASLPVGIISNSKLVNCAVLLGENGYVNGLTTLDLPSVILPHKATDTRWYNVGATLNEFQIHTGRTSYTVIDNWGPVIDLYLEDVRQSGFDYIVSAWVYTVSGTPLVNVTIRQYNPADPLGIIISGYNAQPVENGQVVPPQNNKWQRYEVSISNEDLIAENLVTGGLFNGNPDFIRVVVGAPDMTSEDPQTPYTGGTVYIDDIICRPSNSVFSLKTYNNRRQTLTSTNNNHSITTTEYNYKGILTGIRDENGRILSQSGSNKLGENN